jgi:peptidoglycan/LPS O-acetylase OafA/YrhL
MWQAPRHTLRGKLLGIEAVRGLAALMVVLFHAGTLLAGPKDYGRLAFGGMFAFGRAGVDVFFVLSGFIITLVHAPDVGRPGRLPNFATRRLLRIYPSYWIATLIMLAIMLASPTPGRLERDPAFVLSSLFLLPAQGEPLLGPGWSLRHELLFYALFAACLVSRRLGIGVLGLWFGAIAANIAGIMIAGHPLSAGLAGSWLLSPLNMEFLAGIGVTTLLLKGSVPWPLYQAGLGSCLFASIAAVETASPGLQTNWPPLHLGYAAAAFLILLGLASRERQAPFRVPAWLVRLGDASYALYLLHVIVIMLGVYVLRRLRPIVILPLDLAFILLVACAVACALAFTHFVERPLLAWLGARLRSRRASPAGLKRPLPDRDDANGWPPPRS